MEFSSTEYIDENGQLCESVVSYSWTLDTISKGLRGSQREALASMALRGDLQKMTLDKVEETRAMFPHQPDGFFLAQYCQETKADNAAYEGFLRTKYPNTVKRLYRPNEPLYNFILTACIARIDQEHYAAFEDKGEDGTNISWG